MKVQVEYPGGSRPYAFDASEDPKVGDHYYEGDQVVKVVAIGSDYDGPVRSLGKKLNVRGESDER